MTITNPPETMRPHRKNPTIANVFSQMGIVEELGSGIKKKASSAASARTRESTGNCFSNLKHSFLEQIFHIHSEKLSKRDTIITDDKSRCSP